MSTAHSTNGRGDAAIDRTLMQAQAGSGALFALFLLGHLANTVTAMAGPQTYDAVQGQLRAVYHVPPIEVALVGAPLLAHIVSSVWRMLRRRRLGQPTPRAVRTRLQRWSAIVLLIFIGGHVLATRGASLLYDVWPGFDAIAFTMLWMPAYFIPYYTLFSIAALYHLINGLVVGLPRLGVRPPACLRTDRAIAGLSIVGAVLLVLGVAGFAGAFENVREAAVNSSYARLLEQLGFADWAALGGSP